jgi:hypothetical protein
MRKSSILRQRRFSSTDLISMQTRPAMPLSLVAVLAVAGPLVLDLATRTESDHGMDVVSGKQGGRET